MVVEASLANVDFSDEEFGEERYNDFINDTYGVFGDNVLVGHGEACENGGKYRGRFGCLNIEGHVLALQLCGEKSEEQVYQRPVFYSCHCPSCPKCWRSWLLREARAIEARLTEAAKRYGAVEHLVVSVPPERYGLDFKPMRALVLKAAARRGCIGGCAIYHAFRETDSGYWYFSPHWHLLCFLEGGYECRSCSKCVNGVCLDLSCHGFEAHTRKCFNTDGFIVKVAQDRTGVAGMRISVFETSKYQLSHAAFRKDCKRPNIVTWWGICSYRRLHFKYVPKKSVCPYCSSPLVRLLYTGSKVFDFDRNSATFVREPHEDLKEDGILVWAAVETDFGG